jgi:O-acetyl-ADP-ribose deacetylase (regulator of RNase III)
MSSTQALTEQVLKCYTLLLDEIEKEDDGNRFTLHIRNSIQSCPGHLKRKLMGDLMIANAHPSSKELCESMNDLLMEERKSVKSIDAAQILKLVPSFRVGKSEEKEADNQHSAATKIVSFRGDITALALDAIVNACNEGGMGCFQPSHVCIDNIIHRKAGCYLREECRSIMEQRPSKDRYLNPGTPPLVTSGYALFAKHIIHITGPQVLGNSFGKGGNCQPTEAEAACLSRCYSLCLDACKSHGIRSIAFNCISTGLYGYPNADAATVAVNTVKDWVQKNPEALDLIVFDVFTDKDEQVYKQVLNSLLQSE